MAHRFIVGQSTLGSRLGWFYIGSEEDGFYITKNNKAEPPSSDGPRGYERFYYETREEAELALIAAKLRGDAL